jgi:hypothetical protein
VASIRQAWDTHGMNDDLVARKERWARKMAGREKPAVRSDDRLPPGQRRVYNWPVLDLA